MTFSRSLISCVFVVIVFTGAARSAAPAPKPSDLVGVWELTSATDLKSGKVWATDKDALWWFQFTRSHWTALQSLRDRKAPVSPEAFAKLSADEKIRVSYSRVWDEQGQQLFAARAGTYTLEGDKLHQVATIALYAEIVGIDRVLRIVQLNPTRLVVRTEFADLPDVQNEWTFRRIE